MAMAMAGEEEVKVPLEGTNVKGVEERVCVSKGWRGVPAEAKGELMSECGCGSVPADGWERRQQDQKTG